MLSTVTYALSKKYTDKVVEKATDGVVDKAVDKSEKYTDKAIEKATDGVVDKAVDKTMSRIVPQFFTLSDKVDVLSDDVDQCYEGTKENKDFNKDFAETIRKGCGRYLSDFKGLGQYIDEKQDPIYAWNGERYVVFSDSVVKRVIDKDYKCRIFNIPEFIETEWAFDAYYKGNAVAILLNAGYPGQRPPDEIPPDKYVPIYATEVGPVNKTIILDRLRCNFPKYGSFSNGCRIILNSYQNEPILYKHKFDKINVYTKDETDAAIANAITNVINTAY